jgi:hypothetical protein
MLNVLLYGSESWDISKQMLENIEAFHNNCVQCNNQARIHKLIVDGIKEWIRCWAEPFMWSLARKTNLEAAYNVTPVQNRNHLQGGQLFA